MTEIDYHSKIKDMVLFLKITKDSISSLDDDCGIGELECYGSIAKLELLDLIYEKMTKIFGKNIINGILKEYKNEY